MPSGTIGAPLRLSGDEQHCSSCGRLISQLDIVFSGVAGVHSLEMIATVILGDRKYINTEAPRAISGVRCTDRDTAFDSLRSFKCHNWAYAVDELLKVVASMKQAIERR